jgi:hypothetical protein
VDKDRIRPIAICLFRNDDRILISEAFDSSKRYYYCRPPLNRAIEYGERSRDAMMQEIKEEIDVEIKNLKSVAVLESIFAMKGIKGVRLFLSMSPNLLRKIFIGKMKLTATKRESTFDLRLNGIRSKR